MQNFIDQLNAINNAYQALRNKSKYDDLSDIDDGDIVAIITRIRAAIPRISGPASTYTQQSEEIAKMTAYPGYIATRLIGVLRSLLDDINAGYLVTHTELVHAAMFADYLEMSQHLLDEGYKDPAAVIIGSSLEVHLRQLCIKYNIPITQAIPSGATVAKKADTMNADLAKSSVYSMLEQKNITGWLDLRNKAAHGKYTEYTESQVKLVLMGVQDFIARNPS